MIKEHRNHFRAAVDKQVILMKEDLTFPFHCEKKRTRTKHYNAIKAFPLQKTQEADKKLQTKKKKKKTKKKNSFELF